MFRNLNASVLGVSGHQSEIIELALTYRFRGMDLDIVEFVQRAKKDGMAYARRLIDSARIQIGSFQLPLDWDTIDEDFAGELTKLSEYAQAAAEVGCTRCLAVIEPAGDRRPYHENFEFHRRRLAEICKAMEPHGVRLGVGFRAADDLRKGQAFQFIHDLDAVIALVKMVDLPNIGILLDTWDVHVSGGSVEKIRELLAEQVVAVRVADLPEETPADEVTEAWRSLPGSGGRIDVPAYLAALAELGYDGPVTAAPARGRLHSTRRDAIVKEVAEALGTAWKAADLTADGKLAAAAKN